MMIEVVVCILSSPVLLAVVVHSNITGLTRERIPFTPRASIYSIYLSISLSLYLCYQSVDRAHT